MNITSAKYVKNIHTDVNDNIRASIDGEIWSVPLNLDNRHYAEILKQVKAGTLTIEEAD